MATQKIRRTKSARYTTAGKKKQNRLRVQRRRVYHRAAEAGAPRLVDLVALVALEVCP